MGIENRQSTDDGFPSVKSFIISDTSFHQKHYKVFYYVAEYKSITAAAKALFLPQPTVSHSVRGPEEALGFALFVRNKNGVLLTPEAAKAMSAGTLRIDASEMTLHSFLLKKELPPRRICVVNDSSHPISLAGKQFMALLPSYAHEAPAE